MIPFNPTAQEEVELLRESFTQIIWLQDITKEREKRTRAALKGFGERVGLMFSAVRPTLFFAYASKADKQVVAEIQKVLKEFEAHFELCDWQDINQTGEINGQIIREISRCRYGICYLSEEEDVEGKRSKNFVDNSNVLIEAGMLQALKGGKEGRRQNWIPIREKIEYTTPLPFDFSGQRTIMVPREEDGRFRSTTFLEEFQKMLRELLGIPLEDENDSQDEPIDTQADSVAGSPKRLPMQSAVPG